MLEQMRCVALETLAEQFQSSHDPEQWYVEARASSAEKLLQYLVEAPDEEVNFYTLRADPGNNEMAILEQRQVRSEHRTKLPFNQPTGSQSPALGPILKRTSTGKDHGPSAKIQRTTLQSFEAIGNRNLPWSDYFREAFDCLTRKRLDNRIAGEIVEVQDEI